jgi:hypothetical protein
MRHRARSAFVALASLTLASCSVTGLGARVYGGYMQTKMTGDVALEPSAGGIGLGTLLVDVEDSLGLNDAAGTPYGRVELQLGPARLTGSAFRYSEEGSGVLTASYGDIIVGTAVDTELDLTNVKGALTFDLINAGVVRLSPGIGVDFLDVDMTVRAPASGQTEEIEATAGVPLLFAQGEVDLGPVAATVDGGWIRIDLDEGDGTYWDVESLLRVKPLPGIELFGGFRWISIDVEGEDDGQRFATDLVLRGWFVGGGFTF